MSIMFDQIYINEEMLDQWISLVSNLFSHDWQ